ncbi:MAG: hypothetical protein IPH08_11090 [Rhodocyclaceae bacterium]|nr:hypothetical protein [Rhodocyclaceae bacterium]
MSRILKLTFVLFGLLIVAACGYWYGIQRAQNAYREQFWNETFRREYKEAKHDFAIVQLLAENKTNNAFEIAQLRYYTRLMLASDIAANSSNPNLMKLLQLHLVEAQAFQSLTHINSHRERPK